MLEDLLLQLAIVALGALGGSAFMWLVIGPAVISRAAPKVLRAVAMETFGLSEKEIAAADGNAIKAIATKQGELMASSLTGSLGKIVQDIPTGELDQLAQKYGFGDAKDAVQKLGPSIGGAGFDPSAMANALGGLGGKGAGGFTKIAEAMAAMNSLGSLFGGAPMGSAPPMLTSGSSGGSGGSNPFMQEYLRR